MSFLEKKIQENKDFFDDQQPSKNHRDNFLQRLEDIDRKKVKSERWPNIFRLAAVLVVLISAYFVFKTTSFNDIGETVLQGVTEISLTPEIENVFAYYDAVSKQKIGKIEELAPNKSEGARIKVIAEKQLQNLDANLAEIEKEYAKNPDNKRLKAALVNNKRKKAEVLDQILKQLDGPSQAVECPSQEKEPSTNP